MRRSGHHGRGAHCTLCHTSPGAERPVCTYLFLSVPACTYLYLSVPIYTYRYLYVPVCINLYLSIPIYTYLYLSIPIYTYLHLCIPMYTDIYLSVPIYTYLYLSVPIYTYLYLLYLPRPKRRLRVDLRLEHCQALPVMLCRRSEWRFAYGVPLILSVSVCDHVDRCSVLEVL